MKKLITLVTMLFVISAGTCLAAPVAPEVSYSLNGLNITVDWNSVPDATGYTLYYAPYPYAGPETIGSLGMESATSFSSDLCMPKYFWNFSVVVYIFIRPTF